VLHTWPLFEAIRNSRAAIAICGVLVVLGVLLLLMAWLALGFSLLKRRGGEKPDGPTRSTQLKQVVASAAAWGAPLLFTMPLFSRDMFAYVGQGRLMAAGFNPYSSGMATLQGWYGIGVDPLWADTQTPYGPLFVWLEKLVVISTDGFVTEVAVFVFRLLAVAGLAMLAYYAWRIARLRGLNEAVVLWVVAASPLVLMNFVASGHNDSLMLGFIVAGVYYALKDRPILGTVLVALAAGVKPTALIALPIIGLIWAGKNASWPTIIRRWSAVASIAIGGIVLLGVSVGVGIGWVSALATPVTIASWYAPANIVGIGIGGAANGLGVNGDVAQTVFKLVLLAAGCAAASYLVITRRRLDPLLLLVLCFGVVLLSSPVIHPWYGLWMLSFFALVGVDRLWQVRVVVYSTVFFMLIGLTEPFDLPERLQTDTMIPALAITASVLGAAAIVVVSELIVRRGLPVVARRVQSISN
jgi:hypothetical protein